MTAGQRAHPLHFRGAIIRGPRRCEVNLNAALAVGQEDCECPPNCEDCPPIRTTCYRCGKPACKSCSWVDYDPMVKQRTRRCRDCREDEEG